MYRSHFKYDSEEYKETWRIYHFLLAHLYPSKHEVKTVFKALAEAGIIADSFTQADVEKALAPYDTSDGLIIIYPVKYSFLEYNFKGLAPKFAAVCKAGGPGHDVQATMMFHKDTKVIHDRFDKLESGRYHFVIMAIDVGRADDAAWGSKYYADSYSVERTIQDLEGSDGSWGIYFLKKEMEETAGIHTHSLLL
nr:hypothetical protein [Candidatus Sigynarchaeum springense]MDO8116209.1 hypothetical protein [Candidatus Sigynarchaeota archaeon]